MRHINEVKLLDSITRCLLPDCQKDCIPELVSPVRALGFTDEGAYFRCILLADVFWQEVKLRKEAFENLQPGIEPIVRLLDCEIEYALCALRDRMHGGKELRCS
jgi:hypothetical protein